MVHSMAHTLVWLYKGLFTVALKVYHYVQHFNRCISMFPQQFYTVLQTSLSATCKHGQQFM